MESFCTPALPFVAADHVLYMPPMRSLFGADFFGAHDVEAKRSQVRALILRDIAGRDDCRPAAPAAETPKPAEPSA